MQALAHMGIPSVAISGESGTAATRAKILNSFRDLPEIRVCVISNVGAAGLNIAYCSCLVLFVSFFLRCEDITDSPRTPAGQISTPNKLEAA